MRDYSEVVIIGAGASGLLCGGILAEQGIRVTILEKNAGVGKKLSATGNGRCNFTNLHMGTEYYYGDGGWLQKVLDGHGPDGVIRQFAGLGIYHREKDGYVYPHTNQAVTVVEALREYCRRGRVEIVTDCRVTAVSPVSPPAGRGNYRVCTPAGEVCCRRLVLATGGKAGSELGGDGSGYKLARQLGHTVRAIRPALTGLACGGGWWKQVAGTRIQGRFSLCIDGVPSEGEAGEIQIVKDGVSGIPVFQLCRVAAGALSEGRRVVGAIDFVPRMGKDELHGWLAGFGMEGLVPKKWVPVLKGCGESEKVLKEFRFPVHDTFGIGRAQVTAGGVPTAEVRADTMESVKARGVHVIGELLDIDGKCGGYNLHFAWCCANVAADSIIREIR